jgi:hypothetical protein
MVTFNDLISGIKRQQNEIAESLVLGNCVNFESYQRLVGQHYGLEQALDVLNNLLEEENKDVE